MNNSLLYVIISFIIISSMFCSSVKEVVMTDEASPGKSKNELKVSETKKEIGKEKNKKVKDTISDFTTLPHYWLALTLRGGYIFLLSPYDDYYSSTPMFNFIATFNPKLIDNLVPEIELGWAPVGLRVKADAYGNFLMGGMNLRYEYPISDVIGLNTSLGGGVLYESYNVNSEYVNDKSFTNPYVKGSLGLDININYTYNFNITGEYRYFAYKDKDMQGLAGLIGFSYRFGADPQNELNSYLEVSTMINEVYPAKTPYYSLNGIGELKLKNNLKQKIESATISFYCSDYMDVPSFSKAINDIQPDSEHKFNIRTVFNNKIYSINENREASSVIKVLYKLESDKRVYEYVLTKDVHIMRRNALTWEDTSNLGSFITFNDKPVKEFARDCISIVGDHWEDSDKYIPATNIRKAISIWSGLQSIRLKYVSDPKGFKSSFNRKYNIDYVQYPRDLLKQKTGDCDDFVVLYCSLLENVGINTALITVPGHIFMAIDVGITPYEAITIGLKAKEIIIRDNSVWLPIETTFLATGKSFTEAWVEGLRSMNMAKNTTELITTTYCHSKYRPTPLNHTDFSIQPNMGTLQIYLSNIKPFRDTRYIKTIRNLLVRAVAYARFRMYNKAVKVFKMLIGKNRSKNYAIYANLGNIFFEQKKYLESKKQFEKALSIRDKYLPAVVGMVRVSEVTERATDVNKYMAMLPSQIREKISMSNKLSGRAYMADQDKVFWAIK